MKLVSTLLVCLLVIKAESQFSTVPYLDKNPTIDGVHSLEEWSNIQGVTNFYNHYPSDEGLADNQTEVKLFHNGKQLFIAAVYHDTTPDKNVVSLKRDLYFESIFQSDCFGIAIDPFAEENNGYYFGVNASGVQFDALIGNVNNVDESWNASWQSAVSVIGNDKFYEIAIPLEAMNFDPNKSEWGIQCFTNDSKINSFSTLEYSPRNIPQHDLRFMKKVAMENLPNGGLRKFVVKPSLALNISKDNISNISETNFIPSIDGQYNINQSLRLDVTLNPDFSQVEVDRQVTNLTRFAINFPERRKFFLENSDLFSSLGSDDVNPFYSRRIGAESDIAFGGKLSGNLGANTRIGLLNAQTKTTGEVDGRNYSVLVGRHTLSEQFNVSGYMVNNQGKSDFNRVAGSMMNYISSNKKWIGRMKYAKAFTSEIDGKNNFFTSEVSYNTRKVNFYGSYDHIQENFITKTGFNPLLYNYDAASGQTVREGFRKSFVEFQLKHIPENSDKIDWMRRFWMYNSTIYNEDMSMRYSFTFFSPFAIRFKNTSYVYISMSNTRENLEYNFDFLQNGNNIVPGEYNYSFARVGYWSATNKQVYFTTRLEYGQFYNGLRANAFGSVSYRLLPKAVISAAYDINRVDMKELGKRTFHLARLTTEIFFSNQLNWTTYVQYNTQRNNLNVNSRFQWEYRPLSYVYLVVTNNRDERFLQQNWGASLKVNRRLDF